MFKFDLQRFAEQDAQDEATETTQQPKTIIKEIKETVWDDEYVRGLRSENKDFRLKRQAAEEKLKAIIGLSKDEEITDDKVATYIQSNKSAAEAFEKANERLILAEIKSLDGYDSKLLSRLIDRSKLTIEESGEVKGLTEAVTELEKEFPQVKLAAKNTSGANPAGDNATDDEKLEADYKKALAAGNTALAVALKNKIYNKK